MDFVRTFQNILNLLRDYWQVYLLEGVKTTLIFTCIAVTLGVVLGTVVAMLKMSRSKILRFLISVYIEVIRGTPILLQLYLFYFVLPELMPFLQMSQFMCLEKYRC